MSRIQWVRVPDVANPAIAAYWPGKSQGVCHSRVSGKRRSVIWMMKMVEPYMIIMSPGARTPILIASAAASMVPQVTGVPLARPVSSAARSVIWPAISVDHARSGN